MCQFMVDLSRRERGALTLGARSTERKSIWEHLDQYCLLREEA
jgi:hypothetical protein